MDINRISCCTFPLAKKPLDEALPILAGIGFKKVDLIGRAPHYSTNPEQCDVAEVKALFEKNGMVVGDLSTYVGAAFASDNPEDHEHEYEEVKKAIDGAAFLGARSIRGFRSPKYDSAESVPQIVPWIQKCAEYADEKGIYLCLENHGGGISGNPEVCRQLCERVGSKWFGVLYDPCNLQTRGTDYQAGFETMKDHIVHCHIKDGTSEDKSQHTTMLGDGEVDFAWIAEQLEGMGYEGNYSLEYECELEPPETGLKKWLDTFVAGTANIG